MLITKLEFQKKIKDRVNVYVDGKFAIGLNVSDVVKLGIFKGQEITQDQFNKILDEGNFGKKLNAALNFLSYRLRSEFEVRQFFRRKKIEEVDEVIEKLKKLGQINDYDFAKWFVDQRNTFRPKGKRVIEMELRRKGITSNTIKQLPSNSINESSLAKRALEKYRGGKDKVKIQRFLISRGFDWEIVKEYTGAD